MDGVFTPDWSTYVPVEVQYDSDDRYLVMKDLAGVGGGLETVNVNITVYGEGTVYYQSPDGVQSVGSPYGEDFEVVKGSMVIFVHEGSTYLLNRGGGGYEVVYDNGGSYYGYSCAVLSFYEDGSVVFEQV